MFCTILRKSENTEVVASNLLKEYVCYFSVKGTWSRFWSFFRFQCLQCFSTAFPRVNTTLSVSRRYLSKIRAHKYLLYKQSSDHIFALGKKIPGLDIH